MLSSAPIPAPAHGTKLRCGSVGTKLCGRSWAGPGLSAASPAFQLAQQVGALGCEPTEHRYCQGLPLLSIATLAAPWRGQRVPLYLSL